MARPFCHISPSNRAGLGGFEAARRVGMRPASKHTRRVANVLRSVGACLDAGHCHADESGLRVLSIYLPTYLSIHIYIYIDMCVALNTILHHLIAKHRSAVDASHGSIAVTCSKQLASYTGRDLPCPPAPSQKRRPWHTNNSGK